MTPGFYGGLLMMNSANPVRVLQIMPAMNCGGMENFVMNLYRAIDRKKVQFDFLYHYSMECFFDAEIRSLGGRIYKLSVREDNNLLKYFRQLDAFFKEHPEYKVIHGHYSGFGVFYNYFAKKHGVQTRVGHSHSASHEKGFKGLADRILTAGFNVGLTNRFACSVKAGRYLFKNKSFEVVRNGINAQKYGFSDSKREKARKELGVQDEFVVGHVGRFAPTKNHIFLLEIFCEILKIRPSSRLILIGEGELQESRKKQAEKLGLSEKIDFLGLRSNVDELLCAMDAFVMPSFFEGLPVAGIEAQSAGVPCFFSSEITPEIKITDNVEFLSLEMPAEQWAHSILQADNPDRCRSCRAVIDAGYDIMDSAKKLQDFYISKAGLAI